MSTALNWKWYLAFAILTMPLLYAALEWYRGHRIKQEILSTADWHLPAGETSGTSDSEPGQNTGPGNNDAEREKKEPSPSGTSPQTTSADPERLYENVEKKYGISPDLDSWSLAEWANSEPLSLNDLRGKVAVIRFWTNTCPYCARSMPVLQHLKKTMKKKPVKFIGLYHSKPHGSNRPWKKAVKMTEKWGVTFPVAYDRDWATLKSWWLSTGKRRATSCTFVFNKRGHVTYIHPGPVYFPGDPEESKPARDYEHLTQAIQHALSRPGPDGSHPSNSDSTGKKQ